jgi:hypothetical protein
MIRRDYILRMLEEFFEVLSRIRALQKGQKWGEASGVVAKEFQQLIGASPQEAIQLSEMELLARLIKGEPTQAVREKTLMLATLLKEAGDLAAGQERLGESRAACLKGLHLLLDVLGREDVFERPAFVPRVEGFLAALGDFPLPLSTQAMLMQHFERCGEFGKAEDALFAMIEEQPDNLALLNLGVSFYQRLQSKSEDALNVGNLPRTELEAGLAQLAARKQAENSSRTVASP